MTVENCIIRNNHANSRGGGLYVVSDGGSKIVIRNNRIQDNTSQDSYAGVYTRSDNGSVAFIKQSGHGEYDELLRPRRSNGRNELPGRSMSSTTLSPTTG